MRQETAVLLSARIGFDTPIKGLCLQRTNGRRDYFLSPTRRSLEGRVVCGAHNPIIRYEQSCAPVAQFVPDEAPSGKKLFVRNRFTFSKYNVVQT
jgi:hypothetical protein